MQDPARPRFPHAAGPARKPHEHLTLTPAIGLPKLPFLAHVATAVPVRAAPVQETTVIMKSLTMRLVAAAVALSLAAALLGAASPGKVLEPNKLIILSTTDVKGKNEPCG